MNSSSGYYSFLGFLGPIFDRNLSYILRACELKRYIVGGECCLLHEKEGCFLCGSRSLATVQPKYIVVNIDKNKENMNVGKIRYFC